MACEKDYQNLQITATNCFSVARVLPVNSAVLMEPTMPAKHSSKRELINTGTDKRYVRRDTKGQFKESDDVGRSLASDRRQHAKTKSRPGQGDRGDR
jgi:hypothetical protein